MISRIWFKLVHKPWSNKNPKQIRIWCILKSHKKSFQKDVVGVESLPGFVDILIELPALFLSSFTNGMSQLSHQLSLRIDDSLCLASYRLSLYSYLISSYPSWGYFMRVLELRLHTKWVSNDLRLRLKSTGIHLSIHYRKFQVYGNELFRITPLSLCVFCSYSLRLWEIMEY